MPHRVASRLAGLTPLFLVVAGVLAAGLLLVRPAPAEQLGRPPLPLPPVEQGKVNLAIDRGATFLLATQNPWGSWGAGKGPGGGGGHMIGYTALPALTLLECGLPADHPSIKKAAALIRQSWSQIDATYELALSILFLDRLDDPKDKALIEAFALRLIAGQTPSGGWSYRCPPLKASTQRQLLTVLRQLNPLPALALPPGELGLLKRSDEDPKSLGRLRKADPGPVERCALKPGGKGRKDLARVTTDDKLAVEPGLARARPRPSADLTTTREAPGGGSLWQPSEQRTAAVEDTAAAAGRLTPRRGQCIKVAEAPPPEDEAQKGDGGRGGDRANGKDGGKGDAPRPADGPAAPDAAKVAIPPALAGLPVLQSPRRLAGWVDPQEQRDLPTWGTTDNSNTQFAVLALWVAQRHGLPMQRTMDLVVRRFRGSQNRDGGWGYRYLPGGGEPTKPAMTCVGLIGLAVGHGLAHDGRPAAGGAVQDPSVVNGFVALTRQIGDPAGRMDNLPMADLYYLWSVERVAVLYDLRTIGNKDWYRWGAEILVANQGRLGEWEKGGYPGSHPILDTCLALLFLRRANLVADLTARLPFNPEQLSNDIGSAQAKERTSKHDDAAKKAQPPAPPPAAPPGSAGDEQPAEPSEAAPNLSRTGTGDGTDAAAESAFRRRWWLLVLLVVCVLLLAGGGAACWFGRSRPEEPAKKPTRRKGKKRAAPRDDDG